jgi:hypothetical protein
MFGKNNRATKIKNEAKDCNNFFIYYIILIREGSSCQG